jgi:steroid delta-isomerase-like uncharacterized protein
VGAGSQNVRKVFNMDERAMREQVERHIKAEGEGDVEGAIAVYTDDVEHDVVGWPTGVLHGKDEARGFYDHLTANFRTTEDTVVRSFSTQDALVLEQVMTGIVTGEMLGFPGHGRTITFRILHVFEFRDELISRENVWLDGASIQQQLS